MGSAETIFEKAGTIFESAETIFESAETIFESAETIFESAETIFESAETRVWGFIVWKGVPFCVTFKLKNAEFFLSCVFSLKRCVSKTQFMRFIRLKKNENLCICL